MNAHTRGDKAIGPRQSGIAGQQALNAHAVADREVFPIVIVADAVDIQRQAQAASGKVWVHQARVLVIHAPTAGVATELVFLHVVKPHGALKGGLWRSAF